MFTVRNKENRGITNTSWLDSRHSFSFGHYYDPKNMGFGPLRVINEDWVAAGTGFDTHGHNNMEIITYVLKGALEHKDSTGGGEVLRPGEVQVMSAGKGILHSEINPSEEEEVHLLQIWIMPEEVGGAPGYQQKAFAPEEMENKLRLIVSKDGADGSLTMKQDARLYAATLEGGKSLQFPLHENRKYWLQIVRGGVDFDGQKLEAGDALAIAREQGFLNVAATGDAEVLLFDLPQ